MKKIVLGTAITLAILLSGCTENMENNQDKQGKVAFKQEAEIDFDKARVQAEKSFSKEVVQKWINEDKRLKQLEKEYQEFNSKKGKNIDWSSFDWSGASKDNKKGE